MLWLHLLYSVYAPKCHGRGRNSVHDIKALHPFVALSDLRRRKWPPARKQLILKLFSHPAGGASCVALLRPQVSGCALVALEGPAGPVRDLQRLDSGTQAKPGNDQQRQLREPTTGNPNSRTRTLTRVLMQLGTKLDSCIDRPLQPARRPDIFSSVAPALIDEAGRGIWARSASCLLHLCAVTGSYPSASRHDRHCVMSLPLVISNLHLPAMVSPVSIRLGQGGALPCPKVYI